MPKRVCRVQSLQPQYSLVERAEIEDHLEGLCLAEKIGVIGYYSLASGFLTGKYRSNADMAGAPKEQRVAKYLNDYGFGVLKALDEVAVRYEAKPGQIALAWLIARPSVTHRSRVQRTWNNSREWSRRQRSNWMRSPSKKSTHKQTTVIAVDPVRPASRRPDLRGLLRARREPPKAPPSNPATRHGKQPQRAGGLYADAATSHARRTNNWPE